MSEKKEFVMKRCLLSCLSLLCALCDLAYPLSAQQITPVLGWEQLYEQSACNFVSVAETRDFGYVLAGNVYVTGEGGHNDCILVKTDAQGRIEWQKTYGGNSDEFMRSAHQTLDGGYVFAAISRSPVSGNKESANIGRQDAWLVKVDDRGNKQWDRSFGGTGDDASFEVWQATDETYRLAGSSLEASGGTDYWLQKISRFGADESRRSLGAESRGMLRSIRQTFDGGFVLAGSMFPSPANITDVGGEDGWLRKVDPDGNQLWEHLLGGTGDDAFLSVDLCEDGGLILAGRSDSPASGTKESPNRGGFDYWIVKTDIGGIKQWDQSFGSSTLSVEEARTIRQTKEGGYIFGGFVGGNSWIVKLDPEGRLEWDKWMGGFSGGPYIVEVNSVSLAKDGGFLLSGKFDLPNAGSTGSGCSWGAWAAKMEKVVSSEGEIVMWMRQANSVLESLDDLNGEWRVDAGEELIIGSKKVIRMVPSGKQRYFRLRSEENGENGSRLALGALLTWPINLRQTLEVAESRDGEWKEFVGDWSSIGATNYAIIPQSERQRHFRARMVDRQ